MWINNSQSMPLRIMPQSRIAGVDQHREGDDGDPGAVDAMVGRGQPADDGEQQHREADPFLVRQAAQDIELGLHHLIRNIRLGFRPIEKNRHRQNDDDYDQRRRQRGEKPIAPSELLAHIGRQQAPGDQAGGGAGQK